MLGLGTLIYHLHHHTDFILMQVSGGPGSLAGRYLAAVNSGPSSRAGPGVRLTSSGLAVPSVKQTQQLLLIKTGQASQADTQGNYIEELYSTRRRE